MVLAYNANANRMLLIVDIIGGSVTIQSCKQLRIDTLADGVAEALETRFSNVVDPIQRDSWVGLTTTLVRSVILAWLRVAANKKMSEVFS